MSGDTRPDIVMSGGHHCQGVYWYEQPPTNPASSSWTRHDISVVDGNVNERWFYDCELSRASSSRGLEVLDLDADGDLDVTSA